MNLHCMAATIIWASQKKRCWGWHLVEGRDEITDHDVLLAEVEHQSIHALMSLHMLRPSVRSMHSSLLTPLPVRIPPQVAMHFTSSSTSPGCMHVAVLALSQQMF